MTLAEKTLADYEDIPCQEVAVFALDMGLMSGIEEDGKVWFKSGEAFTLQEMTAALSAYAGQDASALAKELYIGPGLTRGEAAQLMKNALLAADGSGILPKLYYNESIAPQSGTMELDHAYVFADSKSAIEDGGTSDLIVRNSVVRGITTKAAEPLSGPPGGLLVSGNMRTTLALVQSQAYYVNSDVSSANWAVFSTDGAEPITAEGQKELAVYAYNTHGVALDGGYGTYSDLFCNVYFYGADLEIPEIGAISGTFGNLVLGTVADGESDPAMAAVLTEADKAKAADKAKGTTMAAGRNAIMCHCVSLPPYWGREGYSQEQLPHHAADIIINGSVLKTDLDLDKGIRYPDNVQGYIDHHAGSVIITKSCGIKLKASNSQLIADPRGTGAVLHTLINADVAFSVKTPDGQHYPAIQAEFKDMELKGDVIHEDYQRDLELTLDNASFKGKLATYGIDHWNALAQAGGFTQCIIDPEGYKTVHGSHVELKNGSVWQVTEESCLNDLTIGADCRVEAGSMTVDGVETPITPGVYSGNIVLKA